MLKVETSLELGARFFECSFEMQMGTGGWELASPLVGEEFDEDGELIGNVSLTVKDLSDEELSDLFEVLENGDDFDSSRDWSSCWGWC